MKKLIVYFLMFLMVLMFLMFLSGLKAQENKKDKYIPDYIKLQFAGNIGIVSACTGYNFFNKRLQTDLFYGFVPASEAYTNIHTIANKNTLMLYQHQITNNIIVKHSIGFSLNYSITKNTHLFNPKRYPENYYAPNAFHLAPLFSYNFFYINESFKIFKNINLYFEFSTLDNYLWYYMKTKAFNFGDIWNLAIGTTVLFNNK